MDRLYSPWRSKYIESFKIHAGKPEHKGCIFCAALEHNNDEERLLVYRGRLAFVIMNLYPYNSGHLMIVPNRHTADFLSLTQEEHSECMSLMHASQKALEELSGPHGYNLGMNINKAGGAGIDDHLHWHIVPRWNGDTNFMPTIADVKLVSEDMERQWEKLHEYFKNMK